MKKQYISKIPHGDNYFAIPICSLFLELYDRKKMFSSMHVSSPETKLTIKENHKDASERIATCIFYLVTISYRLLNDPKDSFFISKRLDWENLIIYSQILLDSFAILVPIFYGISEKYKTKCYKCCKTDIEDGVSSFNQLEKWFLDHKLNDKLTKRYEVIKTRGWYKQLKTDRIDFIHRSTTPDILLKQVAQELGWGNKIKKDKLIRKPKTAKSRIAEINTIEKELKEILINLFDLLAFGNYFFVEKLKERDIVVSEKDQFKCALDSNFKSFNKLIFK